MNFFKNESNNENQFENIISALISIINLRKKNIDIHLKLPNKLSTLILNESPQFEKSISISFTPFEKISNIEEEILKSEVQLKEDLNDIIERRLVIDRMTKEYQKSIEKLELTHELIKKVQSDYQIEKNSNNLGKKIQHLEKKLINLEEEKKIDLENAKKSTFNLIEMKKKNINFVHRRFKHGFSNYILILKNCIFEQSNLYLSIAEQLRKLRYNITSNNIEDSKNILQNHEIKNIDIFENISNPFNSF